MKMYFGRERAKNNLIPFPYATGSKTANGITYTIQEDGGIHIKGICTKEQYFNLQYNTAYRDLNADPNHRYTDGNVCLSATTDLTYKQAKLLINGSGVIFIAVQPNIEMDGTVYPMLNEGTTALPYFVPRQVKPIVRMRTENLIPFPYVDNSKTVHGITFTINPDGSVTLNGQNNGNGNSAIDLMRNFILKAGTYVAQTGASSIGMIFYNGSTYRDFTKASTVQQDTVYISVYLQILKGDTTVFDNLTIYPMLNEGSTALPYKPYYILQKCTPVAKKVSTNLFNAKKIANTNIKVNEDGSEITMPLSTVGNGAYQTFSRLKELCPELKVGDTIYLYMERYFTDGNKAWGSNRMIYMKATGGFIYHGEACTITEEMLNSLTYIYGNRFMDGETKQVILKDFRITKDPNQEFEPYYQKIV